MLSESISRWQFVFGLYASIAYKRRGAVLSGIMNGSSRLEVDVGLG